MTRSHSEEKRPHSVIPVRAAKLCKLTELKVLVGLGHYANKAGVCWPSMPTLQNVVGVDDGNISRSIQKLVEAGLVRKLEPNDYDQKPGQWGMSNRYQILWAGDDPLPTYENVVDAGMIRFATETVEGSGVRGELDTTPATNRTIAAYEAAVERITGRRPTHADRGVAARLNHHVPAHIEAAVRNLVQAKGSVPSWRGLEEYLTGGATGG
jgi:hypothetical protein